MGTASVLRTSLLRLDRSAQILALDQCYRFPSAPYNLHTVLYIRLLIALLLPLPQAFYRALRLGRPSNYHRYTHCTSVAQKTTLYYRLHSSLVPQRVCLYWCSASTPIEVIQMPMAVSRRTISYVHTKVK